MNINKLKSKIVEAGMTQEKLAVNLGISLQSLNAKLNNRSCLTIEEAKKITDILNIENPIDIFFNHKVPKMQRNILKNNVNGKNVTIGLKNNSNEKNVT